MPLTHNTLPVATRNRSIALLNIHLATAIDLRAQVRQAHWNVRGPGFIAIHELFDEVGTRIDVFADLIAERTAALGGVAHGTLPKVVETSLLIPYPLDIADEAKHVFAVSAALAAFGESINAAIEKCASYDDAATADLFTEISRTTDHQLWLVESHMAPR
jgi:starvation-inducible DNA-binding protein